MNCPALDTHSFWRRVCLTLAALAVVMRVLVPQGFMLSAAQPDQGFQLVLCTGHGAVLAGEDKALALGGRQAPAKPAHDQPCGFAGHGLGLSPPSPFVTQAAELAAYRPASPSLVADLAPGRSLIGPPLPARGPPVLSI